MSSFKTGNKKLQPGTVLIGENGLPVDTIATISGSYQLIVNNTDSLSYAAGVVTVPAGVDLIPVRYHKSRYTGRLILETSDKAVYFIDRTSVVDATKSFSISFAIDQLAYPATIDLSPGWIIAEAEIVNRLATTSAAKIDSIEFRDMQFQLELDGDPVTVVDEDGNLVDFAKESTQLNNNQELQDINSELDALTLAATAANASLDAIEASAGSIDTKLTQTNIELAAVNTNLTNIEGDTTAIETNTAQTNVELAAANASLDAIEAVLSAPLVIAQPVITAGTSNGNPAGPVFVNVNNIKNQILAAHDRDQIFTYADFGTKDQRIIQIDYVSATFPSVTARKTLTYVVDSNRYRRTNITWTLI